MRVVFPNVGIMGSVLSILSKFSKWLRVTSDLEKFLLFFYFNFWFIKIILLIQQVAVSFIF